MKKRELIKILNQRKKECESHRKKLENQLQDLRKEKEIGFDREIVGGVQHPIGYFTGAIEEIKNTIRLLNMSLDDYENEKRKTEKHNRKQKKYLNNLFGKQEYSLKASKAKK